MTQQEIKNLIERNQRRLQKLLERQAQSGIDTAPEILTEIEDIESKIAQLQNELQGLLGRIKETPSPLNSIIRDNLGVLPKLMETPEIKAEVLKFRTDLTTANQQIDILGDYKDLHDLLHDLQFRCYNVLVREVPRFPGEEAACDNLMSYEIVLQEIVDRLRHLSKRSSLSPVDTLWVEEIIQAQQKFHQAVEELEKVPLEECIRLLKHVIAMQPSKFNQYLNTAARDLRLDTIVQIMNSIMVRLRHLDVEPVKIEQFNKGVESLTELNQRLANMVNNHDRWQAIERELNRMEDVMEYTLKEVELSWPYLQRMIAPLCQDSNEEWVQALQQDAQKLDKAFTEQNPPKIKIYFSRYRQRAGTRFYLVDKELKELCGELRKIGEPLTSVLQTLG